MSNIFLSISFIYLASEEVGCLNQNGTEALDSCNEKVHGSSPTSLIANIAVVSGVLSALFMPMFGAIVDYTSHRKAVGIVSATLIILIQVVQIGTISQTWFPMAIWQAISGFIYQVQLLVVYAYLPEISRHVGEECMTKFTGTFTTYYFSSEASFLLVVIILAMALGLNDVTTAQVSQAIYVVWTGMFFILGWRLMPASRQLPAIEDPTKRGKCGKYSCCSSTGCRLLTQGFVQVYHTIKKINRDYSTGRKWFLLALVFAEAGVNSFTVLAVVYLKDHIGLSGSETGIFFLVVLVATLPGALTSSKITRCLGNPNRSWQLCMTFLIVVTAGGAWIADQSPPVVAYIWGVCIGLLLGWFYPTENLFFGMILPKGQEAELSGFFVYCTKFWVGCHRSFLAFSSITMFHRPMASCRSRSIF